MLPKNKENKTVDLFVNRSPTIHHVCEFPGGSVVKNPPSNIGDMSSIPGLGRSPG